MIKSRPSPEGVPRSLTIRKMPSASPPMAVLSCTRNSQRPRGPAPQGTTHRTREELGVRGELEGLLQTARVSLRACVEGPLQPTYVSDVEEQALEVGELGGRDPQQPGVVVEHGPGRGLVRSKRVCGNGKSALSTER